MPRQTNRVGALVFQPPYFGYESFFYERQGDRSAPESQWNLTNETLLNAHLYRLEAGLGATLRLWGFNYHEENTTAANTRAAQLSPELTNAWLRYPLDSDAQGSAIQAGVMPLRSNANAILFGNYLARMDPHHDAIRRQTPDLDSLGSLAPSVTGITLTIGNRAAPVRADAWMIQDEDDYSLLGLISGTASFGFEWGLGFCAYRVLPQRDAETYLHWESSEDTIPDRITWTYRDLLLSGQASMDLASLLGNGARKGNYGGFFAEAALLGWKHNPFVAMSRYDRLIWTLGAHLPTFGWLDVFVVQLENRPTWNYRPEWSGGWATPQTPPWIAGALLSKNIGPQVSFQFRVIAREKYWTNLGVIPVEFDATVPRFWEYSSRTKCLGRIVVRFP
jgi:hypothetical protein